MTQEDKIKYAITALATRVESGDVIGATEEVMEMLSTPQPKGEECCENGNFRDGHKCLKTPPPSEGEEWERGVQSVSETPNT